MVYVFICLIVFLISVFVYDRFIQKTHTIQKVFPIIGHLRYILEAMGGPLRQYFFANDREEKPFNRTQRNYIYASAKKENNLIGFGSTIDVLKNGHFFIKHNAFPFRVNEFHINNAQPDFVPCAKIVGEYNKRRKPYHPKSIVNISGMSYGALGSGATKSNNLGASIAGCYHNTGEGGFSQHHNNGADVVFQIGTAYYGCRDDNGKFSFDELVKLTSEHQCIKMIEIKLSQSAKPGKGGVLPAEKVTKEIADIRKIPVGVASVSPGYHSAFSNVKELIEFVEKISDLTGLPVGIKSAVGNSQFWYDLAFYMKEYNCGPDFITIDAEGGTGAAPSAFADHVSLPFDVAFTTVYKIFQSSNIEKRVVFIGSAKLGLPAEAIRAFALGADMINMAREILFANGCIQAQQCHTGNCPTLIATNKKQHLYNVSNKMQRVANFVIALRKDILEITHACGYEHPCQVRTNDIDVNTANSNTPTSLDNIYGYSKSSVSFAGMNYLTQESVDKNIYKINVESIAKKYIINDNSNKN